MNQGREGSLPKVPSPETVDRLLGPCSGKCLRDDCLMPENAENLDVEMLWHPQFGVER